jgi:hypothetical protein
MHGQPEDTPDIGLESFDPERFIDSSIGFKRGLILSLFHLELEGGCPFGAGRRICPRGVEWGHMPSLN